MYTLRITTRDSKLIVRKKTAKIKVGASVKRGLKGDTGPPGSDGVIQSIVAGDNITVDNADPANPIVSSASGGGGGGTSEWTEILSDHFTTNTTMSGSSTAYTVSIPSGYRQLKIRVAASAASGGTGLNFRFNNDATINYRAARGTDGGAASKYYETFMRANSSFQNFYAEYYITNVPTIAKIMRGKLSGYDDTFIADLTLAGVWENTTDEINSIIIFPNVSGSNSTWIAGSFIEVFGRAG